MKKHLLIFFIAFLFLFTSSEAQVELLGELTKEEILEKLPDWQAVVASYTPKPEVIEKLKSINREIQIEVFLGTWCPDSKAHVSAYFKIMELVENPFVRTTYIGLPRDKQARQEFIEGKNIVRIPTFIVTMNNQEKGRIIETPVKSVEEDLLDITNK